MKRLAVMAVIPLFAGYLCAQTGQTQTTTTTTTTWNGTLLDAACHTTHTEQRETKTTKPDENTTKTQTTHTNTEVTECPATTTTTTFGLMTSDGKFIRFDEPSNTKIVEVVKGNKQWHKSLSDREPIKVRVVGTPNGDVVVLDSIR